MKYIYVVSINNNFEIGLDKKPYIIDTKFRVNKYLPCSEIRTVDIGSKLQMALIKYLPENNILNTHHTYNSFIIRYTDNKQILKVEWFKCIISSYNHIKDLESYGLLRIDKRTYKKMNRVLEDIEKHNTMFPELWV